MQGKITTLGCGADTAHKVRVMATEHNITILQLTTIMLDFALKYGAIIQPAPVVSVRQPLQLDPADIGAPVARCA